MPLWCKVVTRQVIKHKAHSLGNPLPRVIPLKAQSLGNPFPRVRPFYSWQCLLPPNLCAVPRFICSSPRNRKPPLREQRGCLYKEESYERAHYERALVGIPVYMWVFLHRTILEHGLLLDASD